MTGAGCVLGREAAVGAGRSTVDGAPALRRPATRRVATGAVSPIKLCMVFVPGNQLQYGGFPYLRDCQVKRL